MARLTHFTTDQIARAADAVALAARIAPGSRLRFDPVTAALVDVARPQSALESAGPAGISMEPLGWRQDTEELWVLGRHRLVKYIARWQATAPDDVGFPSQPALNAAADSLLAASEAVALPGEWLALSGLDLSAIGRSRVEDGSGRAPMVWVPLEGLPADWAAAVGEARRRVLLALGNPPVVSAYGFPLARPGASLRAA
jgi:hypothetical protein